MSAADTLLEYIERREQVAAQRERAAIVAWLRDEETCRRVARGNLADFIERGVHLRSNDE